MAQTRTRGQIEADMAATRQRVAASLETLIDTVHPNRIKQRTVAKVKRNVQLQLDNAKALVFNSRGDLRTDRVVAVGSGAAGLVAFVAIVRGLVRRGRKS